MDGGKTGSMMSLQVRLGFALTILMVLAALLIAGISYFSTRHDAHELQEDYLVDIAAMVDVDRLGVDRVDPRNLADLDDPLSHVVIQRAGTPQPATGDAQGLRFPDGLSHGLHVIETDHGSWRVYVRDIAGPSGVQKIVVGQRLEVGDQVARRTAMHVLWRILAVIPVLLVVQVLVVRWMLRPLRRLSQELNARHAEDLRELPLQHLPDELRPMVVSMNGMLQRIADVFAQQRRFVADAAHELRSPLTALTLQSKNLAVQDLPETARDKLAQFDRGLQRANQLVEQLMTMARSQINAPRPTQPLPLSTSLQQALRMVLEELMPLADACQCEIGLESGDDVLVRLGQADVVTLLRNLVDNAIRYGGVNGHVTVAFSVDCGRALIAVRDNGPGIAAEERERVFDPFYRVLGSGQSGSGLGLSIVKNIVSNAEGEVRLQTGDDGHGTLALVWLPLS